MQNHPKASQKTTLNPAELGSVQTRANQLSDQRRRELATRSTLSRLRNRKSDLK